MNLNFRLSENDIKHQIICGVCLTALICSDIVIHEYSHIIAMHALYTNINPYMDCNISKLTCHAYLDVGRILRAGSPFTEKTAFGIVNAAGPLGDMAYTAISAIVAWNMRRINLKVALVFAANACIVSQNSLDYALSTRGTTRGDFATVEANLGISHDLQAAIVGSIFFASCALMTYLAATAIKKILQRAVTSG